MAENEPTIESLQAALATEQQALADLQGKHSATSKEAKQHRLEAERLKQELQTTAAALTAKEQEAAAKLAEADRKTAEALTQAQHKALRAEIKAAASAAGARDAADVMALVPADKIELDESGEPKNLAALIEELKTAKPYLFGQAATSSVLPAPKPATGAKLAREMTTEEARAEGKRLGIKNPSLIR